MEQSFCPHMSEYAAQFRRAADAYRRCLEVVDRLASAGAPGRLAGEARQALDAWNVEDGKLRDQLVELVRAGDLRVPRRVVDGGGSLTGGPGSIICATCRTALPRLQYPEWKFAHNGVVMYRGEELPVFESAPA